MLTIRHTLNTTKTYSPIITINHMLFSEEELNKLITDASNETMTGADIADTHSLTLEEYEEFQYSDKNPRRSNISWLKSETYDWVYEKLQLVINHVNLTNFNKMLYGIEALQYSEYDSSYKGFYGPHIDVTSNTEPVIRCLSFSLQLSKPEDYVGGELKIYNHVNSMSYISEKTYGSITFFDSSLLHEVTPVTSGFRRALVGWVAGPRI